MGRKPTISRDALLDAAQAIVIREGANALTIEALAQALAISKGGVQYSFASKAALIEALVDRGLRQFDDSFDPQAGGGPIIMVRAYLAAMRRSQEASSAKMTGLMISYLQNPAKQDQARDWYKTTLSQLAGDSPEHQKARLAFMAIEGVFNMQMFGALDDKASQSLLDEIEASLTA